jgi:peptidoglycan/xylan/chitin deacetylase (PgdA/CDA1 family)
MRSNALQKLNRLRRIPYPILTIPITAVLFNFFIYSEPNPPLVPILMYHQIRNLDATATDLDRTWTVSPAQFEGQMDHLVQKGYTTISLDRFAEFIRGGIPLPEKPVILTFDDGWIEHYRVVFPILKRRGMTGTFYIYTDGIGLRQGVKIKMLREMAEAGMSIGSQSITHTLLRRLQPELARMEITESKRRLEKIVGVPVTSFAYPYAEYGTLHPEMVRRAGYTTAVSIRQSMLHTVYHLYTLRRIRIDYDDSPWSMEGKIVRGY